MRVIASVRIWATWNLFILGLAAVSFFACYHTLDPSFIGTMTGATVEAQRSATSSWVDERQQNYDRHAVNVDSYRDRFVEAFVIGK